MNKICVIGVYFGELPRYFQLWLKSCEENFCVDFLVFCDQPLSNLPENVKYYPMTLFRMKELAEAALGFPVCLDRPYKVCDYKAIYGAVFKKYIEGYDYWGHCDFDLIFGDLQHFFEKYDYYNYDRFLTLGHLSLYRNTEEVNQRYRQEGSIYDYKTVYTTEKICVFDELPGITAIYQKNDFPMFIQRIFADIASIYHRYRVIEEYPLDKKAENYKYQVFYWEKGKVYRTFIKNGRLHSEEYIYIHFKKRPNFQVDCDLNATTAFYITNRGFFAKNGEVTLEDIKKYNPYPGWLYEQYEWIRYKTRKQVQRVKRFVRKVISQDGQR